ncbi:unnamed protein product [Blepharisma stoltei]|uniref:Uncharacterized protein n=1 Tax=Blepharisma stoltei TaxID=1481888 RepID=A0AAU9JIK8_9CILI|nr:unnamed protein product [Blepharisma stoltei]
MSKIEWNIGSFLNERKFSKLPFLIISKKAEYNLYLNFYYYCPSHYADLIYYYSSEYRKLQLNAKLQTWKFWRLSDLIPCTLSANKTCLPDSGNIFIWEIMEYLRFDSTCVKLGIINECLYLSFLTVFCIIFGHLLTAFFYTNHFTYLNKFLFYIKNFPIYGLLCFLFLRRLCFPFISNIIFLLRKMH